ncbi:MAG TPA: cyclase family protein, partial [Casimicrobiaceae bacterium]
MLEVAYHPRMTNRILLGMLWAAAAATLSGQAPVPRIIDLGHPLSASDPTWDGTPAFSREAVATFDKDGYAAGRITVEEHFGTHVDAPAHFSKSGWTLEQIPADRLLRPGVCIDVT